MKRESSVYNVRTGFIISSIYGYKSYTGPGPLKYGRLATKYPRIYGYFYSVGVIVSSLVLDTSINQPNREDERRAKRFSVPEKRKDRNEVAVSELRLYYFEY